MNTATHAPSGLSIQAVAQATGLSRATIYQAAEAAQLGAPAHFTYRGTCISYTLAGLCQLAEGLDRIGQPVGAKLLAEAVRQLRQQAATKAGVTTPDDVRGLASRWDLRAEARQEEIAA